jgi:S1-C subfamily serine protease
MTDSANAGDLLPLVVPGTARAEDRLPPAASDFGPEIAAAVVHLAADIPADARTAEALGTRRGGNGILIDGDGLVLTIGYLIVEASAVHVLADGRHASPARVVGYDHETGFGLVRAEGGLAGTPLALGESARIGAREPVTLISDGGGGNKEITGACVVSRRTFAGYWEYLLDEAIFTTPPHDNWAGAALVGRDGRLGGIGSLMVSNAADDDHALPGNMFVPIDALAGVLDDLLHYGRPRRPQRPWLGMFVAENLGRLIVSHLAPEGPAEATGIAVGDIILSVSGNPVISLADFLRNVFALGEAGVAVPLTMFSGTAVREITVRSTGRLDYLVTS